MNWLKRFLKEEYIDLDIARGLWPPEDPEEELTTKELEAVKEGVLERLVGLFERTGNVNKTNKLLLDFVHRERKATTALGSGIALPHVRTMNVREFSMVVGVAPQGVPFDAPDDEPVRLLVAIAAPPYDDKTYLKVYQNLGEVFQHPDQVHDVIEAGSPGEAIRHLTQLN